MGVSVFVLSKFVKFSSSCLSLSKVNMVVVKVQGKKASGPVASSLPVTVRDTEREGGGGQEDDPNSLHGGGDGGAAGDVTHSAVLCELQGCWKGEPLPSCKDCASREGESNFGMRGKKIHAQGAVGRGCFLQGSPDQHFH